MKLTLKILLVVVLSLSFGLFLNIKEVYANDHKVKSIIIIPSDWQGRINQEKRDKYKKAVLNATRSVQSAYAKILNNKTFDIDENIEVKDSLLPSNIINPVFEKGKMFTWDNGLINVNWVIGTPTVTNYAYSLIKNLSGRKNSNNGIVAMRHKALLDLLGDDGSSEKQFALNALSHELGHAFDLVDSDFAKGHPCSEVSPDECKEKTPKPYPPAGEWGSVMGYGSPYWNFPNFYFNNSIINPEIWKLYRSPFINPKNDPAPEPQSNSIKQSLLKRFTFNSLEPMIVGNQRELSNENSQFGEQSGKFEFFNISSNQYVDTLPESDYEILKWDAKSIIFLVKESAESPTTQRKWRVRIITVNNEVYESSDQIIIQGKDFGKDKQSTAIINFSATCGNENKPLSGVTVALNNDDTGTNKLRNMNSGDGLGQISFIFDNTLQSNYNLVVEQAVEISPDKKITMNIPAEPSFYPINLNDIMNKGGVSDRFNFHFPSCPPAPTQTPTIYVNAIAECGGNYQPVKTKIRLIRKGDNIEVTSGETNKNGYLEFSISNYLIKPNQTYVLKADDISGIPPAELIINPIYHPIVIRDPPPPLISVSPVFHYPECLAGLQPSPTPSPSPSPAKGKISLGQKEVYPAEIFNIYFDGFEPDPVQFRVLGAGTPPAEAKFDLIEEDRYHIALRVKEVYSTLDNNQFFFEIKDKQGNTYQTVEKLTVLGKQKTSVTIIRFGAQTTCGEQNKAVESTGYLFKENDKSTPLAGHSTGGKDGYILVTYSSGNIKAGDTFVIEQQPIDGIAAEPTNDYYRFTIPDPLPNIVRVGTATFHYPTCPAGLQPSPSPSPSSFCNDFVTACWKGAECKEENQDSADYVCSQNHGQDSKCTRYANQPNTFDDGCTIPFSQGGISSPTPSVIPTFTPEPYSPPSSTAPQGGISSPEPSSAASPVTLDRLMVSNYPDFRDADVIDNPATYQTLEWTVSSDNSDKTVFIREIYSDNTYKEYDYKNLVDGQWIDAGYIKNVSSVRIHIKIIKTVVKIMVGDQELDINNPDMPLQFHLPGQEGQPQQFLIPVTITYSDGSTRHSAFTFNYNPPPLPSPAPAPTPPTICPYQENPQNCPYGGVRSCKGVLRDVNGEQTCVYDDSGQVDPACQETCNPAPISCNLVREYDECGSNGGCFGVEQEGRIYSVKQYQGSSCQQEYVCSERENCSAKGLKCENRQCVSIPCDYEEDAQSCPYGGLQTCSGSIQRGECRYDSRINPNCRNRRCNQGPPACGDYQLKGPECDWGRKQVYEVYQDSCGNYDRRNYQTQPGQCGAPLQCSEDIYYCDSGRTIHKYGGYWDGNTCQYAFDDIEQPC